MGVYRGQIKGPLKTGIMWGSLKHTAIHWEKCNERGIPLDAAIVLGGPPCITYAAVQPVPYGVDEVALAGGWRAVRWRWSGVRQSISKCRRMPISLSREKFPRII